MSTAEKVVCFNDEAMLIGWAESNTRGRTVTFLLQEEGEEHPFRHFTVKSGKRAGQRFLMTLVQLDDDETPVEKTPAQLAYLISKDPQFWHWANERSFDEVTSEAAARAFILTACGIDSRAKLDTNSKARAAWEAVIWRPFNKYRESVGAPV